MEMYYTVLESFRNSLRAKMATQEVVFVPFLVNKDASPDDWDYPTYELTPLGVFLSMADAQDAMRQYAAKRRESRLKHYENHPRKFRFVSQRQNIRRLGLSPLFTLRRMSGKDFLQEWGRSSPPTW